MQTSEIIGWKAWYEDGKVYTSSKKKWKNLPRKGLIGLKKFFRLVDEEGNYVEDEESGKNIFYEIMVGHKLITLSLKDLMENKKIPKDLKFGASLTQEQLQEHYKTIEEDQEEPW